MIETPSVSMSIKERLAPVLCAVCGKPIGHFDPTVIGAKAGGLCLRSSCTRDPRTGKPRQIWTYNRIVSDDSTPM